MREVSFGRCRQDSFEGKFPPTSLYVASTAFKFFARGEIITKMVMSDSSEDYNPFRLTKEEIASLDPNYKKPKKKVNNRVFCQPPPSPSLFLLKPRIFWPYFKVSLAFLRVDLG